MECTPPDLPFLRTVAGQDVRGSCAASELHGRNVLSRSVRLQEEISLHSSKWQASQIKLLQALTPLNSRQESNISHGKSFKEIVPAHDGEVKSSKSRTMPRTSLHYDIACMNESTSSRYKDISTLLSVLEMPQLFQQIEDHWLDCCPLSVILKLNHVLGRA